MTLFVHGQDGHLLGEYDRAGNAVQETAWLGSRPIATVRGGQVFAIHVDQLETPRALGGRCLRGGGGRRGPGWRCYQGHLSPAFPGAVSRQ